MSEISNLADRLIDEAIEAGGDIDRDVLAHKLVSEADTAMLGSFQFKGAVNFISERLRRRTAKRIAEKMPVQIDLFTDAVHGLYPVDGEDGHKWKVISNLSEIEAEQVFRRMREQAAGMTKHVRAFDTMLRSAREIWRDRPDLSLGEALSEAKTEKAVAAE